MKIQYIQELDLRDEFLQLIEGGEFVSKMNYFIYRKRRVDKDTEETIKCSCWNDRAREGRSDCPHCLGKGYLWDEYLVEGYKWMEREGQLQHEEEFRSRAWKAGRVSSSGEFIAIKFDQDIYPRDEIYQVEMDDNGEIMIPIVDKTHYFISAVRPMRFDYNKVDFQVVSVEVV